MIAATAMGRRLPDFDQLLVGIFVEQGLRYLFFAGSAWLLGYVLFKRHWRPRKINVQMPESAEVWREVRYSMMTVVIYAFVGALTIWAAKLGWTQMYFNIARHGWPWFWASIGIAIVLHDAYFYWTHRLMHHRKLFRWFHRVHHQSTNPSPWASYSFGPLEALVQALIFPLFMVILPMHPFAFAAFMIWQISFNVAGHAGYEIWPRWFLGSWLGKLMNTPTNHVMHHEKMRGNYGLYFNIWDRLMGTNHPDYEARFRAVTGRGTSQIGAPADQASVPYRVTQLPEA